MKKLILIAVLAQAAVVNAGGSLDYKNNPNNYSNSQLNFENSELNYNNSPMNWKNSRSNLGSNRGVYDNSGNRTGYAVDKSNGGTNYFSDDGKRSGYSGRR